MMFSIVILVCCVANCLAQNVPYSSGSTHTGMGSLPVEWTTAAHSKIPCQQGTCGNNQFFGQTYQLTGKNLHYPTGATNGYTKNSFLRSSQFASPSPYGYYSGQSNIAQSTQPAFAPVSTKNSLSGYEGYPIVNADGYLKDTPEVAQAKLAHFAEKSKIMKYTSTSDQQYSSGEAPVSQYYSTPYQGGQTEYTTAVKPTYSSSIVGDNGAGTYQKYSVPVAGSSYYQNSLSTATGSESAQINPSTYSQFVDRQKRSIPAFAAPLHEPFFHAAPAPFILPHPPMALTHSLPVIHHAEPIVHPTFYGSSSCSL